MDKITWTEAQPFLLEQLVQWKRDYLLIQKQRVKVYKLQIKSKKFHIALTRGHVMKAGSEHLHIEYTMEEIQELSDQWGEVIEELRAAVNVLSEYNDIHDENDARYERNKMRCHDNLCHKDISVTDLETSAPFRE